jgi:hypothetical protein
VVGQPARAGGLGVSRTEGGEVTHGAGEGGGEHRRVHGSIMTEYDDAVARSERGEFIGCRRDVVDGARFPAQESSGLADCFRDEALPHGHEPRCRPQRGDQNSLVLDFNHGGLGCAAPEQGNDLARTGDRVDDGVVLANGQPGSPPHVGLREVGDQAHRRARRQELPRGLGQLGGWLQQHRRLTAAGQPDSHRVVVADAQVQRPGPSAIGGPGEGGCQSRIGRAGQDRPDSRQPLGDCSRLGRVLRAHARHGHDPDQPHRSLFLLPGDHLGRKLEHGDEHLLPIDAYSVF